MGYLPVFMSSTESWEFYLPLSTSSEKGYVQLGSPYCQPSWVKTWGSFTLGRQVGTQMWTSWCKPTSWSPPLSSACLSWAGSSNFWKFQGEKSSLEGWGASVGKMQFSSCHLAWEIQGHCWTPLQSTDCFLEFLTFSYTKFKKKIIWGLEGRKESSFLFCQKLL